MASLPSLGLVHSICHLKVLTLPSSVMPGVMRQTWAGFMHWRLGQGRPEDGEKGSPSGPRRVLLLSSWEHGL